jgi:hypothetical protein
VLDDRTADPTIVFESALTAIERYGVSGASWPCGTHVGESPGLMLGLSGIGHHLLRLSHPLFRPLRSLTNAIGMSSSAQKVNTGMRLSMIWRKARTTAFDIEFEMSPSVLGMCPIHLDEKPCASSDR